jgi:multidrug resistance efflux pump
MLSPAPIDQREEKTQAARWLFWQGRFRGHPYVAAAVVIAAATVSAASLMWWQHLFQYESTDDAFVDARTVAISSQITGAIIDLQVTDNQIVDGGALLARIDSRITKRRSLRPRRKSPRPRPPLRTSMLRSMRRKPALKRHNSR